MCKISLVRVSTDLHRRDHVLLSPSVEVKSPSILHNYKLGYLLLKTLLSSAALNLQTQMVTCCIHLRIHYTSRIPFLFLRRSCSYDSDLSNKLEAMKDRLRGGYPSSTVCYSRGNTAVSGIQQFDLVFGHIVRIPLKSLRKKLLFRTKLFRACELAKANLSSTQKSTSVEFVVLDNLYFFLIVLNTRKSKCTFLSTVLSGQQVHM